MIIAMLLAVICAFICGAVIVAKKLDVLLAREEELSDKHFALYLLMIKWVRIKQQKKEISEYLIGNGYRRIVIYGLNYVGECLIEELKDTGIEVICGIDIRDIALSDIHVIKPSDDIPDADLMVITPYTFFDEIETQISKKVDYPIISIDELLDSTEAFA